MIYITILFFFNFLAFILYIFIVKNHLLSITNLIKIFEEQVVIKKISFSIKQNSILGILGKNGAGKTTLLGMLMGLIKPTSGEIKIFGKDLEKIGT